MRTGGVHPPAKPEISRFPCKRASAHARVFDHVGSGGPLALDASGPCCAFREKRPRRHPKSSRLSRLNGWPMRFPLSTASPASSQMPTHDSGPVGGSLGLHCERLATLYSLPVFPAHRFPCVHAAATTPVQRLGRIPRSSHPGRVSLPREERVAGSALHIDLFSRPCSAFHSRLAAWHNSRGSPLRDPLSEGFQTFRLPPCLPPVASGWSGIAPGGASHPLEKRRLCHGAPPLPVTRRRPARRSFGAGCPFLKPRR